MFDFEINFIPENENLSFTKDSDAEIFEKRESDKIINFQKRKKAKNKKWIDR